MTGLPGFFQAHGGVIAVVIMVLVIYNALMAAFAKIFEALGKQEPEWMQKAGAIGLTLTQWLSANTPTPGTVQVTQVSLLQKTPPPNG